MSKGTAARGKWSRGKSHIVCRRCGRHSFHTSRKVCASCGYGKSPKRRTYHWKVE
ncbi:50S ribosomal protein L37e [Candidatus Woesearchaeota archaeon]|nr:MAG: 50S ribosomal protein L37e [Candidatus Woesearchaeota archaeon]